MRRGLGHQEIAPDLDHDEQLRLAVGGHGAASGCVLQGSGRPKEARRHHLGGKNRQRASLGERFDLVGETCQRSLVLLVGRAQEH